MDQHEAHDPSESGLPTGSATVRQALAGVVQGDHVNVQQAATLLTLAGKGGVTFTQAGSGPVIANGPVTITQGGTGPLLTLGEVSVTQGGAGYFVTLRGASLDRSWIGALASFGRTTVGAKSRVGVVISPRVVVEEGGKVAVSTPQALAFGAGFGLVAGGIIALVVRAAGRS